ncbi:MAG: LPS export ABC transporter periplasmic protein LptC [Bacteroidaceae bacterium]|nr:LPS export ABC transporter periplasmic protein LptC [Bacteroidaceae bacterium]
MKKIIYFLLTVAVATTACTSEAPPMGAAIESRDSLPVMTTYGVSKLISDSGIVRYKIIAEEWRVFDKTVPQRQEFPKGLYLERYDNNLRTNLHITADTAFCYDQNLWKLRGHVMINDIEKQLVYQSEELYWDMRKHIFYANTHFIIDEPTRHIEGYWFESDEQMKKIKVKNSSGFMPFATQSSATANADSTTTKEADVKVNPSTTAPERNTNKKPAAAPNQKSTKPSTPKPLRTPPAIKDPVRLNSDGPKTDVKAKMKMQTTNERVRM